MTSDSTRAALVLGLCLIVGLAAGGYFVGNGLLEARASQRYVTVKGLSERMLPANLVIWPLVFTVTADDLGALQEQIDLNAEKIFAFLLPEFGTEEYSLSMPRITDHSLQSFAPGTAPPQRYAAEVTLTLRSPKIDRVKEAMQRTGELVKAGVPILRNYGNETQFFYTDLEAIKPEMIAAATRDARRAAEQFANDSGSRVGGIRKAQQGYFSIEDRDRFSPEFKTIRVVTTVEYFLVDP
jgi:hypothetical protein